MAIISSLSLPAVTSLRLKSPETEDFLLFEVSLAPPPPVAEVAAEGGITALAVRLRMKALGKRWRSTNAVRSFIARTRRACRRCSAASLRCCSAFSSSVSAFERLLSSAFSPFSSSFSFSAAPRPILNGLTITGLCSASIAASARPRISPRCPSTVSSAICAATRTALEAFCRTHEEKTSFKRVISPRKISVCICAAVA